VNAGAGDGQELMQSEVAIVRDRNLGLQREEI